MSKRYTLEEKASAVQTLSDNCGNIQRTSQQTGIPSRTLYTWWNQEQTKLQQLPQGKNELPPPPLQTPSAADHPEADEDLRADGIMDEVLEHLMQQARMLSLRFSQNYEKMPPTSQMMALTRLIDRIIKLDARKPRTGKELRVRVIRVDKGEKESDGW
jgi:transposase-like protein